MFVTLLMPRCATPLPALRRQAVRRLTSLLIVCLCVWFPHAAAAANPACDCDRPLDSVWLVSTREASCATTYERALASLQYFRLETPHSAAAAQWQSRDAASFSAAGPPGGMTLFYVHGNRVSRSDAFCRGLAVYRALVRHARDARPIRFVIWSWPSAAVKGLAKDVRVKAYRTGPAGYRLAAFVNRLEPDEPVGMIGFSFGARVITGALHVLGGGSLGHLTLPAATDRMPVRAVLMSAAVDCDWLVPGHYHGMALTAVDRILLLNNSCDRALKWYPLIDRCRRPQALGRDGIAAYALGMEATKVEQRDVCCVIGRVHGFHSYLCAPSLIAQTWAFVRAAMPAAATDQHLVMDRNVE